jgi:DNA polymerase-3 subunit beta
MKVVIQKDKFLEGLQTVQNVVSSRTTLPILNNVLIQAKGSTLTLSTTDLDTGIRSQIEAKIEKEGSITLPAKKLVSIVRELPVSEISLEVDAKFNSTIRAGNSFFRIVGLAEDDFPPFPKTDGAISFKIEQSILKDLISKTAYAMSTDESRYVLNGTLFSFKEGKLTVVATDGRRLALVENELEFAKGSERDVIVPGKAIQEISRILSGEGDVQITLSDNQIGFQIGKTYLVSKLIEGNYPNYKQVIPSDALERITIERELLLNAVRRMSLLSNEKSSSVKLNFTKNNLDVSSNTPDVGEARESLPIAYKGKEFSIAFNPDYLMAPLKNLDTEEVFLDFTDELSPGVVRYKKPFLYVIMPMRTA